MLTQQEMRILKYVYTTGCKLFTVPITFKNGRMYVKTSPMYSYFNYISCIFLVITASYRLWKLPITIQKKNVFGSVLNVGMLLVSAVQGIYKLNIWTHKVGIAKLINETLEINSLWGEELLGSNFVVFKIRERGFSMAIGVGTYSCVIAIAFSVLSRNEEYSPYQLISNDYHWITSLLAFLALISSETFVILDVVASSSVSYCTLYLCCISMQFWLKKFCIDWLKPDSKIPPQRCIIHYRGIYTLNNDCNIVFGMLILPFVKLLLGLGLIMCIAIAVRLNIYLDTLTFSLVLTYVPCTLLTLVPISNVMSSLYSISRQFPRNLDSRIKMTNNKKEKLGLSMQLKACPLIRCQVAGLYHMEAKAKLTMLQKVVNATKYLLVNLKAV